MPFRKHGERAPQESDDENQADPPKDNDKYNDKDKNTLKAPQKNNPRDKHKDKLWTLAKLLTLLTIVTNIPWQ